MILCGSIGALQWPPGLECLAACNDPYRAYRRKSLLFVDFFLQLFILLSESSLTNLR